MATRFHWLKAAQQEWRLHLGGRLRVASCVFLSTLLVHPWVQGVDRLWLVGARAVNGYGVGVEGCAATRRWAYRMATERETGLGLYRSYCRVFIFGRIKFPLEASILIDIDTIMSELRQCMKASSNWHTISAFLYLRKKISFHLQC